MRTSSCTIYFLSARIIPFTSVPQSVWWNNQGWPITAGTHPHILIFDYLSKAKYIHTWWIKMIQNKMRSKATLRQFAWFVPGNIDFIFVVDVAAHIYNTTHNIEKKIYFQLNAPGALGKVNTNTLHADIVSGNRRDASDEAKAFIAMKKKRVLLSSYSIIILDWTHKRAQIHDMCVCEWLGYILNFKFVVYIFFCKIWLYGFAIIEVF